MRKNELFATATLAYIGLSEEEIERLSDAVSQMLDYFSRMNEVDVNGLEPTTHAFIRKNRLREDRTEESVLSDTLLERSPECEDRFIVIPNVL